MINRFFQRIREWKCRKFGHSFNALDLLMFKIECEGRCFTIDLMPGDKSDTEKPTIDCRCCGERFQSKNRMNDPDEEARERLEYYREKFEGDEIRAQEIAREEKSNREEHDTENE